MAKTRAFISFDYDHDLDLKNLLVGQAQHSDSPFEIADWSVKGRVEDLEGRREEAHPRFGRRGGDLRRLHRQGHRRSDRGEHRSEENVPYFLLNGHSDKTGKKPTTAKPTDKLYKDLGQSQVAHRR